MLRSLLALVALSALTGCATPLQHCLVQAEADVLAVQRELDDRRAALHRGYAIEHVQRPVLAPWMCTGAGAAAVSCLLTEPEMQEIRRPINRTFESERIALLEQQLARARAAQAQASAHCRTTHPA